MMNRTTAAVCAVIGTIGLAATAVQAEPQVKKPTVVKPGGVQVKKPAAVKPGGAQINKPAVVKQGAPQTKKPVAIQQGGTPIKKPAVVKQGGPQFQKPVTVPKTVVKPVNPNLKPANVGVIKPGAIPVKPAPAPLKLGPGNITPLKPVKPPPNVTIVNLGGNKVAPYWKGGGPTKKIWWGGGWKSWVLPATLGVVVVGGTYLYADGYLSLARPYCSGITPDGCRLHWQQVAFLEGGSDWQCVQYCRHMGPPPARTVAFVPPPPMPAQAACEITIFPEPNFGGGSVTTGEEQPQLSQSGWQNQIASLQIKAGTWDFFSDEQFTGETMRLAPGEYPDLGPDWTRRTGSFMCVQP